MSDNSFDTHFFNVSYTADVGFADILLPIATDNSMVLSIFMSLVWLCVYPKPFLFIPTIFYLFVQK